MDEESEAILGDMRECALARGVSGYEEVVPDEFLLCVGMNIVLRWVGASSSGRDKGSSSAKE